MAPGGIKQIAEEKPSQLGEKFRKFKDAVSEGKRQTSMRNPYAGDEGGFNDDPDKMASLRSKITDGKTALAPCRIWSTADLVNLAVIGQGGFGTVHLVKQGGHFLVLKKMSKKRLERSNLDLIFAERAILNGLRGRWFVEMVSCFQDNRHLYMLMEFCNGGDLWFHMERLGRFTYEQTIFYMAELLQALDLLHKYGFVHRDVKPENAILTSSGHLKLLDFGLCKQLTQKDFEEASSIRDEKGNWKEQPKGVDVVGTFLYMAPEMYFGEAAPGSDVWAVGVIMYECSTGLSLFSQTTEDPPKKFYETVRKNILTHEERLPRALRAANRHHRLPPHGDDFLSNVLCMLPRRLTIPQCRAHPFFFGVDFETLHLKEPPLKPQVQGKGDIRHFASFPLEPLPDMWPFLEDASLSWAHYDRDGGV